MALFKPSRLLFAHLLCPPVTMKYTEMLKNKYKCTAPLHICGNDVQTEYKSRIKGAVTFLTLLIVNKLATIDVRNRFVGVKGKRI